MKQFKREYIMVVGAGIAVLYGLYSFLFATPATGRNGAAETEMKTLNQFTLNLAKEIDPAGKSAFTYIIETAAAQWPSKPFLANGLPGEEKKVSKKTTSDEGPMWRYYGYMEVGDKRLAIINRLEYEEGESLEDTGYQVVRIFPTRVVLEGLNSQGEMVLHLDESLAESDPEQSAGLKDMRLSIAGHQI